MLTQPLTIAVELQFRDKGGKEAQVLIRFLPSLSMSQLDAASTVVQNAILALSNAALVEKRYVWKVLDNTTPSPSLESDVTASLDLFYTNSNTAYGISIPSPKWEVFVNIDSALGYLLDRRNPSVQALTAALTSALALTVDTDGISRNPMLLNGVLSL